MQDSPLRKSTEIEEELAWIKAQLNLNSSKMSESDLCLSRISVDHENHRLSVTNMSLIDLKLSEINHKLFNNVAECERVYSLEKLLIEKNEIIEDLQEKEIVLEKHIEALNDQVNQYEVDLQYCINQNALAFNEIQQLKIEIDEKNLTIEKLKEEVDTGQRQPRPNYKLYAQLDNVIEENLKLKKELGIADEKNEELRMRMNDAELKFQELMNDVLSMKRIVVGGADEKKVEGLTMELYRKIVINLESENKELKSEFEFLKVKVSELEALRKKEAQSEFIKDLINELGLNNEKELYKKVLYLMELAKQGKEQRMLIKKIASIITKKTGNKEIDFKEMSNYITANLR